MEQESSLGICRKEKGIVTRYVDTFSAGGLVGLDTRDFETVGLDLFRDSRTGGTVKERPS